METRENSVLKEFFPRDTGLFVFLCQLSQKIPQDESRKTVSFFKGAKAEVVKTRRDFRVDWFYREKKKREKIFL